MRDGRILLAKRTGGGVAWIGEPLPALRGCGRVQRLEAPFRHIDLAADLDARIGIDKSLDARIAQAQRYVAHRAHIDGDIFARGAVAARRSLRQHARLVRERDGRAVDLKLAAERHRMPDGFHGAREPFVELFQAHGVVQRIHAHRMAHGRELLAHVPADALRRAGRIDELRMGLLEFAQFAHQRIERRIGDFRRILRVIEIRVVLDFLAKRPNARTGPGGVQSLAVRPEKAVLIHD